jgi:hypothetical protein
MGKEIVLARVKAADQIGLTSCPGARPGDLVFQAMAPNGDSVLGVFHPIIPGNDVIAQARPWPEGAALLVLHRLLPDAR